MTQEDTPAPGDESPPPAVPLFLHHDYLAPPPAGSYRLLVPEDMPRVGSAEFAERMAAAGRAFRAAGVGRIYLLHGTFAGLDMLGLLGALGRLLPQAREIIGPLSKRLVDAVTNDRANYTPTYARLFQRAINEGSAGPPIEVRLFNWSSENHHLGRADAAVRLIEELANLPADLPRRVLLWGHSHGGNVLALVSQLLAGSRARNEAFFDATRAYFRWPLFRFHDIPVWARVEQLLRDGGPRPLPRDIDIVTFGTPVRYGWDQEGAAQVMHFVNHHPVPAYPPYQAAMPRGVEDVLTAKAGDYVQHFGIAGTNIMPAILAPRAWLADRRLHRLIHGAGPREDFWTRIKAGRRVHDAGTTLLVDYGPPRGNVALHMAGHAVYTLTDWMLFHVELVAREMYGLSAPQASKPPN